MEVIELSQTNAQAEDHISTVRIEDPSSTILPRQFNVGKVTKHFVGREQQLHQLQQINDTKSYKTVLINGLGGIGKTEMIKKFSHNVRKNVSCTWVDAETEETLNKSLTSLAEKERIRTRSETGGARSTSELLIDIITNMSPKITAVNWLVIFDNVYDLHPDLSTCLELLSATEDTLTILNSRNTSLAKENWKIISLEEWEIGDAMKFVKRSLLIDTDYEDDSIAELCNILGYHALSMQLAVAYITHQQWNSAEKKSYAIWDYIIEADAGFRKTNELCNLKLSQTSQKFAIATLVTCEISLSKMKETRGKIGYLAASILQRIAYFNPNNISLEFIAKIVKLSGGLAQDASDEMVNDALRLLKAYKLVEVESNRLISTHPFLQEVIRRKLNFINEEVHLLNSLIQVILNFPSYSRFELPHVLSVWTYSSNYDNLIRKFPDVAMTVFNRLLHFGMVSQLYNFALRNVSRLGEVLGDNNYQTLGMKHNLAFALKEKGELLKSLEVYSQVWETQKKNLGENHSSTLATAHNLAEVLSDLKRHEEAKELYEKVLGLRKETLGEDHPHTMRTKYNLAYVLTVRGELTSALEFFNEVSNWQKRELGERHPATLTTKHNIGCCLFRQGKYPEAKKLFENVFYLSVAQFGNEHFETLTSMYWLGLAHSNLTGGKETSLEILLQVLEIRKKNFGPNHPDTLATQKAITEIEGKTGKLENEGNEGKTCSNKLICFWLGLAIMVLCMSVVIFLYVNNYVKECKSYVIYERPKPDLQLIMYPTPPHNTD